MAEREPAPAAWLEVSRKELQQALRLLHKFASRRDAGEAQVGFESGELVIRLGGVMARAPAQGAWAGEAVAPGWFFANFHRSLPETDPVTILVDRERLKIGISAVKCSWSPRLEPRITLPVDAKLPHILRLALEHEWKAIEESGLDLVVADAQEQRDELLERAAKVLAPLEISADALQGLVEAELCRRFKLCLQ